MRRNKDRFYSFRCPKCGFRTEFMMDLRKFKKLYSKSPCPTCNCEMWQESTEDRERYLKNV